MNGPAVECTSALKPVRLAAFLIAILAWPIWSGAAVAADIESPHSITCTATTVHAYRDVQATKSWDVDDQLADPSLVFEWRPQSSERPSIEIDGRIGQLVAITDTTLVAVHGGSDRLTVRRWLYAINFSIEDVVGIQLESNIVSVNGRVAEFSCEFEAALN